MDPSSQYLVWSSLPLYPLNRALSISYPFVPAPGLNVLLQLQFLASATVFASIGQVSVAQIFVHHPVYSVRIPTVLPSCRPEFWNRLISPTKHLRHW